MPALRSAALEAGAHLVTQERVTGVRETAGGAVADFADGRTETADPLVAADGIHSAVRGALGPAARFPEYGRRYAVSGTSRRIAVEPGVFSMPFARDGAFIHLVAPGGEVWWSARIANPVENDWRTVTDDEWRRRMCGAHVPASISRCHTTWPRKHHGPVAITA